MDDYNPYRPTSESFDLERVTPATNAELQKMALPRSFWTVWVGYTCICLLALIVILFPLESSRGTLHLLGLPLMGLLGLPLMGLCLVPFVSARAKLCEKYQHRCMASNGIKIFFTCLGVCFGLGYAVLGMSFLLYTFLSVYMESRSFRSVLFSVLLVGTISVVSYLKLIDLSARSPRLNFTNKTGVEKVDDASTS